MPNESVSHSIFAFCNKTTQMVLIVVQVKLESQIKLIKLLIFFSLGLIFASVKMMSKRASWKSSFSHGLNAQLYLHTTGSPSSRLISARPSYR